MGFRFRKSIKLGKGVRLNLGKKSVGLSFGGKGFRTSINSKRGITSTLSIPGTGISYITTSKKPGRKPSHNMQKNKISIGKILLVLAAISLLINYWMWFLALASILTIAWITYSIFKPQANDDEHTKEGEIIEADSFSEIEGMD